jgi:hypothetical protein
VYKSKDGGANWNVANTGLKPNPIHIVTEDPSNPATLYAGTVVGIYASNDAAASWNA